MNRNLSCKYFDNREKEKKVANAAKNFIVAKKASN